MCGIVGYIGGQEAWPIIYEGLRRLEYRGYAIAGIAIGDPHGDIQLRKHVGKVTGLDARRSGREGERRRRPLGDYLRSGGCRCRPRRRWLEVRARRTSELGRRDCKEVTI